MSERRPRRHRIRVGTDVRYTGTSRGTFAEPIPPGTIGIVTQELVPVTSGRRRWHSGEIQFPSIDTGREGNRWRSNWVEGSIEELSITSPSRPARQESLPEGYYRDAQGKLRSIQNHPLTT